MRSPASWIFKVSHCPEPPQFNWSPHVASSLFRQKVKSSEFQEAKNFLGGKKFDKLKTQTKNIQTRLKLQKGDVKNEQKGGCGTHYKKNKVRDDTVKIITNESKS